ncbi:hypothetical protein J5X84_44050 [Streptosporangiaceae bacterium NEAU-GS5]|nr:hypothetical protein [Streptosporangiaceae bacterium NEAU-GS5]
MRGYVVKIMLSLFATVALALATPLATPLGTVVTAASAAPLKVTAPATTNGMGWCC